MRNRLRRLEKQTGRSLPNPRAIAELVLAYEIDCGSRGGVEETAMAGD